MQGARLCGFLLDDLVVVAKMLKEHPELMNVKDAYVDGYRKGYEDFQKSVDEAALKAVANIHNGAFPHISTDGGLDLQGAPTAEKQGSEEDGVF